MDGEGEEAFESVRVGYVGIGTPIEEPRDEIEIRWVLGARTHQRRVAILVLGVDVGTLVEHRLHHVRLG